MVWPRMTNSIDISLLIVAVGQIIASLETIIAEEEKPSGWNCIHPRLAQSSKQLYLNGHFAEAAFKAFVENNDVVKELYVRKHPKNGTS